MQGIFISYRQDDTKPWALLLHGELAAAFGEEHVFLDKDTLRAGSWRAQIQAALDRCGIMFVLIGRGWLGAAGAGGERRIERSDDFHRHEIAHALARKDVVVVPVLVDGARLPSVDELPIELRALHECQCRELSDRSARRRVDLDTLFGDIERVIGLRSRPRVAPGGLSALFRVAVLSMLLTLAAWVALYRMDGQQPSGDHTLLLLLMSTGLVWLLRWLLQYALSRRRRINSSRS